MTTKLTKSGRPRMGSKIDVQMTDDSWVTVTVVGYTQAKSGGTRDVLLLHPDGGRDWVPWGEPDGVIWRPRKGA